MPKMITSASNPVIKELVKIKTDSRFRYEGGMILIEGEKLIRDVSLSRELICLVATDEKWLHQFRAKESFLITPELLKKIASTETPIGVVALVEMPKLPFPKSLKKLLVLDRIQDPGNVGALIRTAYALSWEGVFLLEGTADPFNDKALRAAKGGTFHVALLKGDISTLKKIVKENDLSLVAADMEGEIGMESIKGPIALVLGNEGQGITKELIEEAKRVSIPMREGADSLNVASTGAILMYSLGKS